MATRFSSGVFFPTNASNAIRDWAQFIEDTLVTTGGWTVSSDTGQTLPSALTSPGGSSTKAGYRIYKMADALQATFPVFMRLDFGSGAGSLLHPGVWITIGTGSNGSGTITGKLFDGGASANATVYAANSNNSLVTSSFGSATTSRICIALFCNTTSATYYLVFGIERTKDSSGADTGDGILMVYNDSILGTGIFNCSRYLIYAGGTQPTIENGLSYALSKQNPTEAFVPGDIGVGLIIHFKGTAQQPGTLFNISNSNDVTVFGSFNMTLYGQTRTYQNLGNLYLPQKVLTGATPTSDNNARVNMRYD